MRNDFKAQVGEIKDENNSIINIQQVKIDTLENQNKKLQNSIIQLQRKVRKNNLVVFGVKEIKTNLIEQVTDLIRNTLEVEIQTSDINDAYKIGVMIM